MSADYMTGGEPFELPGADAGILLLHGFSGSCSEIRDLGQILWHAGYGVYAPALAGHGTAPGDLEHVSPDDFFAAAHAAFAEVRKRYARVYVVGLSMGGTLGLHLAAREPMEGLVTISTPVFMSPLVAMSVPLATRFAPKHHVISNYAAWRGEVVGYRTTPVSSLRVFLEVVASVRADIPRITTPLLVLHSTGDKTVPVANAPYIAAHVSSESKAMRIYHGGRHLLTLPPHLDDVQRDVVRFLHAREAPYVTAAPAPAKGGHL
ncbi:MAG: alpha/beta fold hydrolase [Candidatus Eremiobacteraeota bacterium]|nr:alpha/beta fold hydrolase [Candidatus Eremiobacteraeota bacterium]MBV8264542.1 alpha/beta fold hydrolase [Candidatus Eremiobacteraeota bacterium]MBV8668961.1 alpha/beta fold hydrolase [Candidatus Eremiobacteraeota bacterium]